MRVLFVGNTPLAKAEFGGREVQMLETRKALESLGIYVELYDEWKTDIGSFDILHLFGLEPENLRLANYCKNVGLKIVVSSVFWPLKYRLLWAATARLWPRARLFENPIISKLKILRMADKILPNTTDEEKLLKLIFGINTARCKVIPNGVDTVFENVDPRYFREQYSVQEDFVLFVGRIEKRKNLTRLIRATKELNLPLVVIGAPNLEERDYVEECHRLADKNVRFLGPLPKGSALLRSAYAACRVFALPSYYETPGLSALEAALAGANIVITEIGGAREYFIHYARYVKPSLYRTLVTQISAAWGSESDPQLPRHILEHFSWDSIAEKTSSAYGEVVKRNT